MAKLIKSKSMTETLDFAEIEEAMARGRRERSLAFTSAMRSLFGGRQRENKSKSHWSPDCAQPA